MWCRDTSGALENEWRQSTWLSAIMASFRMLQVDSKGATGTFFPSKILVNYIIRTGIYYMCYSSTSSMFVQRFSAFWTILVWNIFLVG